MFGLVLLVGKTKKKSIMMCEMIMSGCLRLLLRREVSQSVEEFILPIKFPYLLFLLFPAKE